MYIRSNRLTAICYFIMISVRMDHYKTPVAFEKAYDLGRKDKPIRTWGFESRAFSSLHAVFQMFV